MNESLNILRDRSTGTAQFRNTAGKLCSILMRKQKLLLRKRRVSSEHITVVIILRAAVAFLAAATREFPDASVGVLGLKRNERTLAPRWYYENLPHLSKKSVVIILDPMLATGGSAEAAIKRLIKRGADAQRIYFVGIIGASVGLSRLARHIPQENITLAALDKKLNARGMIVPGLGDFGDRYAGYTGKALV